MGTRSVIWVSILLTVIALFIVGIIKAKATQKRPLRSGLEIMALGTASGLLGYLIGWFIPWFFGIQL